MKSPQQMGRGRANDEQAMTSMIDVVFLLLVFFVWTSSFDLPETELPGQIAMASSPQADSGSAVRSAAGSSLSQRPESPRQSEIVVRIVEQTGQLSYRVGAVSLPTIAAVRDKLAVIARLPIETIVIVDPDDAVSVSGAVEVFDLARQLGFRRVVLAVEPAGS
ncbi:ExbD/TolR family protein [Neorhodopirellula lusitana]|uniref:ExbD/TolR family protein n=1 Tax=Neorhodopirellula lusitana TaxID=445327 RepID=UPI00385065D6